MTPEPACMLTPEQVAELREFQGGHDCSCMQYIAQLCESHEALRAERDEARAWGEDLARRAREVTCVWCGHQFESTLASQAEHLYEHAKVCDKHPLRAAHQRIAEAEKAVRALREVTEAVRGIWAESEYSGLPQVSTLIRRLDDLHASTAAVVDRARSSVQPPDEQAGKPA